MVQERDESLLYNENFPKYSGRVFGFQQAVNQERINMDRMRKERLEKARAEMRKASVSVMLLLNDNNMEYTTGYKWLGYSPGGAYILLPLEGDPIIFGHSISALHDRRQMPWIKPENVRFFINLAVGGELGWQSNDPATEKTLQANFGKQIKDALKEMKLDKEVVTFDMHDALGQDAMEQVGVKMAVRKDILIKAQEIKTEDEINCFRATACIVDIAHYEVSKFAEPGKSECEIAGYMNYIAMKYGSDPVPNSFVSSGQHSHPNYRTTTDKFLRPGDIFFCDTIQFSWNGYKSCCYRNYSVVRPPSQAAKDAAKRMVDIIYAALSECKPGKTTADMMKHWPKRVNYPGPAAGNVMHGLGIQNYGPPVGMNPLSLEHPYPIKEGQVFAIETETGIGDGQGVRIEEMVVVTKTGYEVLTKAPLEIITVPLR